MINVSNKIDTIISDVSCIYTNNYLFYRNIPKNIFKINKKVKHYGKMPRKLKKKYKNFYYKHGYFKIDSIYSCNYFFGNNKDIYEQANKTFRRRNDKKY